MYTDYLCILPLLGQQLNQLVFLVVGRMDDHDKFLFIYTGGNHYHTKEIHGMLLLCLNLKFFV